MEDLLAVYTNFCAAAPAQNFMVGHSFGCAACNMQRKYNMHHACHGQRATGSMQYTTATDMQLATYDCR